MHISHPPKPDELFACHQQMLESAPRILDEFVKIGFVKESALAFDDAEKFDVLCQVIPAFDQIAEIVGVMQLGRLIGIDPQQVVDQIDQQRQHNDMQF